MHGSLQVGIQNVADGLKVSFTGKLDETAQLATLLPQVTDIDRVILNLSGISVITSVGVREWHRFITAIPERVTVELEQCSPSFVGQLNIIRGFAGKGRIKSVYAPYVCESCGYAEKVLVHLNASQRPMVRAPACRKCASTMTFDDIEVRYFNFVTV